MIRHEDFNKNYMENDIALVELATDVTFTKFIRPACLQQNTRINDTVIAVSRRTSLASNFYRFLSFRLAGVILDIQKKHQRSF